MTLEQALEIAERSKRCAVDDHHDVLTALDVLYEHVRFLIDETECDICGDVPRDHSYSTCSAIFAGR